MIQIRCMAVDDEPIALEKLENYIRRIPFLELVALCESPVEAVQIMMEQRVDALFVDINMPDLNGMGGEVAIQSLELCHEGLEHTPGGVAGEPSTI